MKRIAEVIFFVLILSSSSSFANDSQFEIEELLGSWEGTSRIASGFGFLIDKAILEVNEVDEDRFLGTLIAIAPNNEHEPVITTLAGVMLPEGIIHASAGTGGIVSIQLKHGRYGEYIMVGSSMSTVAPNEEFPFLPIASILELRKSASE